MNRAIMCSWYYPSQYIQETWIKTAKWISLQTAKYPLMNNLDCTQLHIPSLLDCTFRSEYLIHSQVYSMYASNYTSKCAPKYTSEFTFQYTPATAFKHTSKWTQAHLPSLLNCALHSQLSGTPEYNVRYSSNYTSKYAHMLTSNYAL